MPSRKKETLWQNPIAGPVGNNRANRPEDVKRVKDMMAAAGLMKTEYVEDGMVKRGWPIFMAAIRRGDWKAAARESHRQDVQKDRNETVRKLLEEAARH